MGNLDNSSNSLLGPGTSRSQVVGLSNSFRNVNRGGSRVRDPLLINRINQYLNDNKDQTYVIINDMVEALRKRHREYKRRPFGQFKILVERAFRIVSKQAVEGRDTPQLSDTSTSDVEECNDSDGNHMNSSNSQLMSLYQPAKSDKMAYADDLVLINLSSDDEPRGEGSNKQPSHTEQFDADPNIPAKLLLNPDVSVSRRRKPANKQVSGGQGGRGAGQMSTVSFADFGGSSAILEEVCKLILHIKYPEVFRYLGVSAPRGFLLHGPPGCGKTLLASAIAGELKVPLIKVSGPELVGGVSGESEERVRELFASALETAPCVLFIDEVDAITPNRQTAQREMERRIVAQLLTSLDDLAGKDDSGQVLVIGATKRPDALDPALRRAGRFDREVCLGIPDEKARLEILRVLCSKVRFSQEIELATIARMTPGFVGADLLSLIREAVMIAIKRVFALLQEQTEERKTRKRKRNTDALATSAKRPAANESSKGAIQVLAAPPSADKPPVDKVDEAMEVSETAQENEQNVKEKPVEEVVLEEKKEAEVALITNGDKEVEKEGKEKGEENVISVEKEKSKVDEKKENGKAEDVAVAINVDVAERGKNSPESDKEMDVVGIESEEESPALPEASSSLNTLLAWVRDSPGLSRHQLSQFAILQSDLVTALRSVQPSAKREGFATVPDVTWDDVGSLANVREHLKMTILGPIKYEAQFERLGLVAPAGVLLCGPPGCGKTLLAKAVANEAGINFISVKGPELLNMYVGESERAVRTVFQRARNSAPCVIFFDELDALCPRRTEGDAGAGMRVVNQMLTEMDGVGERRGVFLMAATNRPDIVDPAVLRPGRLDRTIYIGMPNAEDRKDILIAITKNGKKPPLDSDVSLAELAARPELENWTGADLAALMREAAMQAVREATADLCVTAAPASDAPPVDIKVTAAHVERALTNVRPSVSSEDLKRYEEVRKRFAPTTGDF